jgi:hypothetical protein
METEISDKAQKEICTFNIVSDVYIRSKFLFLKYKKTPQNEVSSPNLFCLKH